MSPSWAVPVLLIVKVFLASLPTPLLFVDIDVWKLTVPCALTELTNILNVKTVNKVISKTSAIFLDLFTYFRL
jgi:hypothetical protein